MKPRNECGAGPSTGLPSTALGTGRTGKSIFASRGCGAVESPQGKSRSGKKFDPDGVK
jgi:hypothetical protein